MDVSSDFTVFSCASLHNVVDQGNVDETPHDILLPNSSSPALSMVEEDTAADQAREGDVDPGDPFT